MKIQTKLIAALCFSSSALFTNAQTNTFPGTGNVGIGTLSPINKLTVQTGTNATGIVHTDGTVRVGSYVGASAGWLGTVSNHPLYFYTNNGGTQIALLTNGRVGIGTTLPLGKLDVAGGDAYIHGVRVGVGGKVVDTTNTCLGRNALRNDSTSNILYTLKNNTAIGLNAMKDNTVGSFNCAVGSNSLSYNTTGSGNTALGPSSLVMNKSGIDNVAIGRNTLESIEAGEYNCAVGSRAMQYNADPTFYYPAVNTIGNTGVGSSSCMINSGHYDTGVGYKSLFINRGNNNTAIGTFSLASGRTEISNEGSENTAIGYESLGYNTLGIQNTACGNYSMYKNKTGNYNTGSGRYVLFNNTSGSENTALGDVALYYNQTGSYNTAVGYFATPNAAGLSNTLSLGYNAITTASNQVRIGNSGITSIGGYVGWTNVSDGRIKRNIKENVPGLSFINQLKPVTYNLDLAEADKIINYLPGADSSKAPDKNEELLALKKAKQGINYTGFIAQDVEKAAKGINYDFSGVDVPKNEHDLYGIRYAEFVVPLVKAVQELSEENEKLKAKIYAIEQMLKANQTTVAVATGSLEQNVPNPTGNSTVIGYTLPSKYTTASIQLTDNTGKKIKQINLAGSGKGTVLLNTNAMNAGAFQYSLYIDNGLVETKQMLIVR